jgi:hypothetical protein
MPAVRTFPVLLSLGRYHVHCWWTVKSPQYHQVSIQNVGLYYYQLVDTTAGGLLVSVVITRPLVRTLVCINTFTLPLGLYHC